MKNPFKNILYSIGYVVSSTNAEKLRMNFLRDYK